MTFLKPPCFFSLVSDFFLLQLNFWDFSVVLRRILSNSFPETHQTTVMARELNNHYMQNPVMDTQSRRVFSLQDFPPISGKFLFLVWNIFRIEITINIIFPFVSLPKELAHTYHASQSRLWPGSVSVHISLRVSILPLLAFPIGLRTMKSRQTCHRCQIYKVVWSMYY